MSWAVVIHIAVCKLHRLSMRMLQHDACLGRNVTGLALIINLGTYRKRSKQATCLGIQIVNYCTMWHGWSQVIMLLLGGFAIASALSKHYIAKAMATWVLLKVGQKPSNVLLASMFVAMFASMWISNVAAPALCFSLLQPILRTLETGDNTSKSLVMGTFCPYLLRPYT